MPACPSWRTPSGRVRAPGPASLVHERADVPGDDVDDVRLALQGPVDDEERVPPHHPPQARPGIRPERDVHHPGLVLEGEEDRPLRRHRVLAGDDEAADPDRPGPPFGEGRVGDRPQRLERRPEERDDLAPRVEREDRVGVAQPLELRERRQVRGGRRRQAQVQRPPGHPPAALRRALRRPGRLAELPEQLPSRPPERIQRPGPDQPLEDLLGEPRPLHDVGQRRVRPAGPLGVQVGCVLLADPLHEVEPEPDAPADRALGRPALARGVGRDHAGGRADRAGAGGDPEPRRQRLARVAVVAAVVAGGARERPAGPAHPFGRRPVGATR